MGTFKLCKYGSVLMLCLPLSMASNAFGQSADSIYFDLKGEHLYTQTVLEKFSAYSSEFDQNGAPYLYTASMQLGLVTFDISDLNAPVPVDTMSPVELGMHNVSNVVQEGSLLYLSLGDFQSNTNPAGLAIVDVSAPASPTLISMWDSAAFQNGAAITQIVNDRAYIGIMTAGLLILDIADPQNISYVNHFIPDPAWPAISNFDPAVRGLAVRNDTAYLAYDAGAFRIVDLSNEMNPVEVAMYVNPNHPVFTPNASNHVQLVGNRAFVSYDNCGLEVLDISDPNNVQQIEWINPWNCLGLSWFGGDGHGNEMLTVNNDSLLFLGAGDSELLVYDITGVNAELKGGIILPDDSVVAWGIAEKDGVVALTLLNNSGLPLQPFFGGIGGIRLYEWTRDLTTSVISTARDQMDVNVYPNPAADQLRVETENTGLFSITDMRGTVVHYQELTAGSSAVDLSRYIAGIYVYDFTSAAGTKRGKLIIE